jgi:hypothetical protein
MVILLLAGFLGILFQVLAKMASLKKDFEVANQPFVTSKFFEREWVPIASSVVFILIMAITLPEILTYKPIVEQYVRILFVFGGAIGSWAFGYALGKSRKYIRNVIDIKTNIADAKTENDE